MELAAVLKHHLSAFTSRYGHRLSIVQFKAVTAIQRCRTKKAGQLLLRCPDCDTQVLRPLSCGNRCCPGCQNHETSRWLDRQRAKLLPVEYFMATFTLPYELRALARDRQKTIYNLLFACAASTLKDFGLNPKHLGADIGMTAVLHTHSRRLEYHPHLHVVVPGGGVDRKNKQWKKKKGKYLFNEFALAEVFRARLLAGIKAAGLAIPTGLPKEWVVDCKHVGKGKPALEYLSRYLYRGVISEKNIVSSQDGNVTFLYVDSKTGQTLYCTLKGEEFLWLVLQHVLPKGLRRVRDYGFLHGNAKKTLFLVQLILQVVIEAASPRPRPAFKCPECKSAMELVRYVRPGWLSG
jgi:hypothetical protein